MRMAKKSVAKNSLFNVFYRGVTTVFPLITTAYVSRALLPEGVGKVTYATTVVTYFTLVASLGIPNYGIKSIAQKADDPDERSRTFFELFTINLISTLVCIVAYYIFVNSIPYYKGRRMLFNIVGLRLVLNILNVDWFYQGIEEYKLISIRGVTVRIVSLILMIIFVHQPSDYLKYALILTLGYAGNNVYNGILLRKFINLKRYDLSLQQHMGPVLVLLASTIATEIYTMLDTVMLEYFHGEASVGYYSNAVKIVRTVYNMTIAIATPFYPRISWHIRNKDFANSNKLLNEGAKVIYLIAFPASVGLITTSTLIAPFLYGKAFLPSAEVIRIIGILVVVFSTAYMFGHIILMSVGREKDILKATISGAVVNFVLNLILIPKLMQGGAAIASVSAELVVTTVLVMQARHYFTVLIQKEYVLSVLSSLAVMTAVIFIEMKMLSDSAVNTMVIVMSAVVVYGVMLLITRNDIVQKMLMRISRRFK